MVTVHRSFERLETVPIFSPHTHIHYIISTFTSYLKLLLYLKWNIENACSLWERKSFMFAVFGSLTMTHKVVPPLPAILAEGWLSGIVELLRSTTMNFKHEVQTFWSKDLHQWLYNNSTSDSRLYTESTNQSLMSLPNATSLYRLMRQ